MPVETLFGILKGFQSLLNIIAYTNIFLWPSDRLNFIYTFRDSIYLSLKNCSILSYRDAVPSSQRLPKDSSPGPLHPGPIREPDEPFDYRRSPRSSAALFSSQHIIPIFGLQFKSWPNNMNPHIKYTVRPLKPHQYVTMSSTVLKVGPTLQAPETMCCRTLLILNLQIQWKEARECFHSTSRSSAHRFCYP